MWSVVRRYPVAVPVAMILLIAGAWMWISRIGPQLDETGAQAAIYDRFEPYPGSDLQSSRRYEHRADGNPTGHYGLEVVYRLPADVAADEVLDHYRRQIPPGWTEASDATCLGVLGGLPTPPAPAPGNTAAAPPGAESFRLQQRGSQLTVFTDEADVTAGRVEGLTLMLSRTPSGKFATLDGPTYSCGAPDGDRAAAEFDAP